MPQWRFFILLLHHIAAQRQSVDGSTEKECGFQTVASQLFQTAVSVISLQFGDRPVMVWRWRFRTGGRNGPKRIVRRQEDAKFETAFRGENSWQVNTTVDK